MNTHQTTESGSPRPLALVTGGRQGLGRSTALQLAADGFDLVIADLSSDGQGIIEEIESLGGRAAYYPCDISDVHALPQLVDTIWAEVGAVDCLVNNAGVASRPLVDMLEISPEEYDRVVNINERGTYFLSQAVAKRMLASEYRGFHRSMIFLSSVAAQFVNVDRAPYHVSKTGVSMISKLFAVRLAEHEIASYEVRPGFIQTAMTASATDTALDDAVTSGRVPQRRWGQPTDVAHSIAALAAGQFPYSTGQTVWVDGGLHVQQY